MPIPKTHKTLSDLKILGAISLDNRQAWRLKEPMPRLCPKCIGRGTLGDPPNLVACDGIVQDEKGNKHDLGCKGGIVPKPDTIVREIQRVGDFVEVFADVIDPTLDKALGARDTLYPDSIRILTRGATIEDWAEVMTNMETDFGECAELVDLYGQTWQLGKPAPEGGGVVERIIPLDQRGAAIFASLDPKAFKKPEDRRALVYELFPCTVARTTIVAEKSQADEPGNHDLALAWYRKQANGKACPECETSNTKDALECENCDHSFEVKACPKCGAECNKNAEECESDECDFVWTEEGGEQTVLPMPSTLAVNPASLADLTAPMTPAEAPNGRATPEA